MAADKLKKAAAMPAASERLKQSYGLLQDYFSGQN